MVTRLPGQLDPAPVQLPASPLSGDRHRTRRLLGIGRGGRRVRAELSQALALLDQVDVGIAVLDERDQPTAANAFLRQLLTDVPGLEQALRADDGGRARDVVLLDAEGRRRVLGLERNGRVVQVHDHTAARHQERLLRESEARFRQTFDSSPVGKALLAAGSDVVLAANAAFASFLGTTVTALTGRGLSSVLAAPEDLVRVLQAAGPAIEVAYRRADGSLRWGATTQAVVEQEGGGDLVLLQVEDIQDRVAARTALDHQVSHDPLTGLINRRTLIAHVEHHLQGRRRGADDGVLGLLLVDLDGFTHVNDTYGHDAGDVVLAATARRLLNVVRADDHLARLGGDQFVLVTTVPTDPGELVALARRVCATVASPVLAGSVRIRVTASVGISTSTDTSTTAGLLREAQLAVERAKDLGTGRYEVYDVALRHEIAERARVEQVLRHALSCGGLGLVYQPVVSQSGSLQAVEALARLTTPEGAGIGPGTFVPVAERTGLVVPLGLHVLDTAVAQAAHWQAAGTPLRTAVNVSAGQLASGDLERDVRQALERHGLRPDLLELEVTETALLGALPTTRRQLARLRERGVRIAIDDYGTGHASLAYLHQLPATTVKVDASFVAGLPTDVRATAIVRAVTQLAQDVGIECVAEGVETPEQRDWLRENAPHALLQGYLLGRPVPVEQLALAGLPRPRGAEPAAVDEARR